VCEQTFRPFRLAARPADQLFPAARLGGDFGKRRNSFPLPSLPCEQVSSPPVPRRSLSPFFPPPKKKKKTPPLKEKTTPPPKKQTLEKKKKKPPPHKKKRNPPEKKKNPPSQKKNPGKKKKTNPPPPPKKTALFGLPLARLGRGPFFSVLCFGDLAPFPFDVKNPPFLGGSVFLCPFLFSDGLSMVVCSESYKKFRARY